MLLYVFLAFFLVFYHKTCAFIIFIFIFDEVADFYNRILTNQKQQLVIENFQWNCMTVSNYVTLYQKKIQEPWCFKAKRN